MSAGRTSKICGASAARRQILVACLATASPAEALAELRKGWGAVAVHGHSQM
jgi:hypothetical protein